MTWLKWALFAVAAIGLLFGAVMVYRIGPRNLIGMWRYDQRREGDIKVGDRAVDVSLIGLDGSSTMHLRDRIGERPLVLLFGSYT